MKDQPYSSESLHNTYVTVQIHDMFDLVDIDKTAKFNSTIIHEAWLTLSVA